LEMMNRNVDAGQRSIMLVAHMVIQNYKLTKKPKVHIR